MSLPLAALLPLPLLVLRAGLPLLLLLLPRRLRLLLQLLLLLRIHPAIEAAVTCPASQITQPIPSFCDAIIMRFCLPILLLLLLLLLIYGRAVSSKAYYSLNCCCCCWRWCSRHRTLHCSAACKLSRQQATRSLHAGAAGAAAIFASRSCCCCRRRQQSSCCCRC
jgi:hypothetical protein